ncbi:MAG: DUF4270 domain-containing protein [Dysgonamonadaceae bacterium]|jgi:ribosomal protein L31|nr:DUF4270 domain-containing protein [Dysgonamonadaceae bacterium]
MKTKFITFSLLSILLLFACEEDISNIGTSVQPDEDKVSVVYKTFNIASSTVHVDSVYAKTINGSLGEYYDPDFGTLKAGFACEFYPSYGFQNINSIKTVDSVFLSLHYKYTGDSLAPMELTVFPAVKPLEKNYYSNVNPEEFCDMSNPITRFGYTARNLAVSDSMLAEVSYDYNLYIPFPKEFGQRFLDSIKTNPSYSSNIDEFRNFFKGIYIASTYGTGSLLYNISTEIHAYYTDSVKTMTADGLSDSIYPVAKWATWAVTKEVVQLNSYKNSNDEFMLQPDDTATYIKSPAGIYTEIIIPIDSIYEKINKKQFSAVSLKLNPYPASNREYALPFPGVNKSTAILSKILLIEPDSINSFFLNNKVADGIKTYTATFDETTDSYNFENISNIVQDAIEKNPNQEMKLWVVPVQTLWTYDSNYNAVDYSTAPYLLPSGVKLKAGGENLQIHITASSIDK